MRDVFRDAKAMRHSAEEQRTWWQKGSRAAVGKGKAEDALSRAEGQTRRGEELHGEARGGSRKADARQTEFDEFQARAFIDMSAKHVVRAADAKLVELAELEDAGQAVLDRSGRFENYEEGTIERMRKRLEGLNSIVNESRRAVLHQLLGREQRMPGSDRSQPNMDTTVDISRERDLNPHYEQL
jgi:hypothetical protein